jgi:MFS family permease
MKPAAHAPGPAPGAPPTSPPAGGWPLALWLIPLLYLLFVTGEFLAMTHLTLNLTQRGHSAFAVGVVASSLWVGLFTASWLAHHAVERFGHARVMVWAGTTSTLAVAAMVIDDSPAAWAASAFLLGLSGGFVWVGGESWLAEDAPADRRGFFVGLFETSVGLGFVGGPALLPLSHAIGVAPLHVAVLLMALGGAGAVLLLRERAPPVGRAADALQAAGENAAARAAAAPLAWVVGLSGLLESGSLAMLPPISMQLGFDMTAAAVFGAVIGGGSALLQVPAGALADRIGLRRTMLGAWWIVSLATAVLAAAASDPGPSLWVVGFLLGGVGGSVYTLVVIELGHRHKGRTLVRAMALLVTAYTAGTTVGPVLGGALFDAAGLRGLAVALLVCCVAGLLIARRTLAR